MTKMQLMFVVAIELRKDVPKSRGVEARLRAHCEYDDSTLIGRKELEMTHTMEKGRPRIRVKEHSTLQHPTSWRMEGKFIESSRWYQQRADRLFITFPSERLHFWSCLAHRPIYCLILFHEETSRKGHNY